MDDLALPETLVRLAMPANPEPRDRKVIRDATWKASPKAHVVNLAHPVKTAHPDQPETRDLQENREALDQEDHLDHPDQMAATGRTEPRDQRVYRAAPAKTPNIARVRNGMPKRRSPKFNRSRDTDLDKRKIDFYENGSDQLLFSCLIDLLHINCDFRFLNF
jgi:hypothetical protein